MSSIYKKLIPLVALTFSMIVSAKDIVIGQEVSLRSNLLNENRELQVFLPESYAEGKKHYPVLFVMDSQRYFLHAIAHQQTLRFQDKTPEIIVIGLKTDSEKRRHWLYPERETFINFLTHEAIPWIDSRYRTSGERLYFGWEMAAGLVPDLIASQPTLFQAYLMASPTHVNRQRIDKLAQSLRKAQEKHFVYSTLGSVETWSIPSMAALEKAVLASPDQKISWKYDLLEDQDHYTTPLLTIDNGLLHFYSDYGPLRFYSIQEFNDFGGLTALKKHYLKRGKRFDVSTEIHDDTKGYLLNQSLKENNLVLFTSLVDSFEGFIERYYVRDFWFNRFANAYIKLEQFDKAAELLNIGIKKLPKSHMLYASLAKVKLQQSNLDDAKNLYKKAISIAADNEKAVMQYQAALTQLN